MRNVIVVGANSAIAKEYLRSMGAELGRVALCGRDGLALEALALDLAARHPAARIETWVHDARELDLVAGVWSEMVRFVGVAEEVVLAAGALGRQEEMRADPRRACDLILLNCAAVTCWALTAAATLKKQRAGCLGIVTSVAGVRGRASNYVYGSTKAQLICLAEGLRLELAAYGVRVVDFRPGMVATPMTAHLKAGLLMASPVLVGSQLGKAMERGDGVVYSPRYWSAVMFAIRHVPFTLFKKMKF